jgi:Protein of unknown function (DUF3108)
MVAAERYFSAEMLKNNSNQGIIIGKLMKPRDCPWLSSRNVTGTTGRKTGARMDKKRPSVIYPTLPAKSRRGTVIRLLAGLAWFAVAAPATVFALDIPEKLVYDMTWTGIKAGTATEEISYDGDSVKIVSTVRSADWISVFFPVEDRVESVLTKAPPPQLGLPRQFRMKVREGRHRRDKEMTFDHKNGKAYYVDHLNKEKATIDILPQTYDTYSSFYFIRTMKLEVGKPVYVNILDSKQLWNVEVLVLKKERIETILGKVDTIVIRPLIKSEGIFDRKGAIDIWLTDDERRIPVRMKTKVAVGSITATLVDIKH